MGHAYAMAGLTPKDVNAAELHDCFTVMGAIGTEVIGKAEYGKGAQYWVDGKAAPDGECGINTSGGLIARAPDRRDGHRDDRLVRLAAPGQGAEGAAGEEPAGRGHLQHRRSDLRLGLHGAQGRGLRPPPAGAFTILAVVVRYDSEDPQFPMIPEDTPCSASLSLSSWP
jgi:hypothetical protein